MLEGYNAPYATPAFREFLADEAGGPIHAAQGIGDTGAEPVVDAIRDGVECAVRGIDGDTRGGAAEERRLEGIGERDGGYGLEDGRVVGDDDGGWRRERFLDDLGREASEDTRSTRQGSARRVKALVTDERTR